MVISMFCARQLLIMAVSNQRFLESCLALIQPGAHGRGQRHGGMQHGNEHPFQHGSSLDWNVRKNETSAEKNDETQFNETRINQSKLSKHGRFGSQHHVAFLEREILTTRSIVASRVHPVRFHSGNQSLPEWCPSTC